jgi:hypothetical protein
MASSPDTLVQGLEWFKHAGLTLLLYHIFTGLVTYAFRKRTPEELDAMAKGSPRLFKLLKLAEATGLNSPAAWKWAVSLVFAKTIHDAQESAAAAGVPAEPPVVPSPLDGPHT